MLSVEECLERLVDLIYNPVKDSSGQLLEITSSWDIRFINDVFFHISSGRALSTSQGAVVLKLIRRYDTMLVAYGLSMADIDSLIATPHYKKPPYQSTEMPREVRWIGNNRLAFRCKFNAGIQEDIKKLKGTNHFQDYHYPSFHRGEKLWLVEVNSGNVDKIMDLIRRHNFNFDDKVTEFFMNVTNSKNKASSIETIDNSIRITVCNDDLLHGWLSDLQEIEDV